MLILDPKTRRTIVALRIACPITALFGLALCVLAYLTGHYFLAVVNAVTFGVGAMNTFINWTFYDLPRKGGLYGSR